MAGIHGTGGPMIGPLFALEGFAFFTEAIFLGIYLYGWSRVSRLAHFSAGLMVGLSGVLSAMFVVTANAWMNAPTGIGLQGSESSSIQPWAAFLHPLAWHESIHMLLAAFSATGFLVAGIHAFLLRRRPGSFFHREAVVLALLVGGLPAVLQPISGDLIAKSVARHQPAKLAAMEALFHTKPGASFVLFGLPDESTQTVPYSLSIPSGLSPLLQWDPHAVVEGLDRVPREDWPPVAIVHLSFQLMVGCGLMLAALACWSGWRWWHGLRLEDSRWLLRGLLVGAPLGLIAIEAGWVVTEVGRQPWIIDHVMRTAESVTPMSNLWIPMSTFTLLYLTLAGVVVWTLWRHIAATQEEPVAC